MVHELMIQKVSKKGYNLIFEVSKARVDKEEYEWTTSYLSITA
jgi:hypothetical protein